MKVRYAIIPALFGFVPATAMAAGTPCDQLAKLALPQAKIDSARIVPAGDFRAPGAGGNGQGQLLKNLPAFCRIAATLTPSSDSDIKVEVWMPTEKWNGRLEAEGNGGWAGRISYSDMAESLRAGYAVTSTDTGHSTPGGAFALGHPEKLVDFGWRSPHEMALKSKAIVAAFYGRPAEFAYFRGCSTGGRQGLMEATRFPTDFDGIIAGDPSNPRGDRNTWQLSVTAAIHKDPASVIPKDKLPALHQAVLDACDTLDGVKDRLIENPAACHFDTKTLLTKGFSQAQAHAVDLLWSPGRMKDGTKYHPGLAPGSEMGLDAFFQLNNPDGYDGDAASNFQYAFFSNPDWSWKSIDADHDLPIARKVSTSDVFTADMKAFMARGGKFIFYHGWADPSVTPVRTVEYYNEVLKATPQAKNNARMFLIPGMGHCGGGEGATDTFDMTAPLDAWVSKGVTPASVRATHVENGKVTRSRPLCPYPQTAHYNGSGSTDDAANFTCKAP